MSDQPPQPPRRRRPGDPDRRNGPDDQDRRVPSGYTDRPKDPPGSHRAGNTDGPARSDRPDRAKRPVDDEDPYDYERIFVDEGPEPSWHTRLSRRSLIRVATILGLVVLLLVSGLFVRSRFDPGGSPGAGVTVQVPPGATLTGIAGLLDSEGVVPSALAFRLWARVDGDAEFQAGEYGFVQRSSASEALAVLRKGPKERTDRLTIPEGLRLRQVAERVGRLPGFSEQRFLELATNNTVRSSLQPPNVTSLEGLLFPDTYLLSAGDTESTLLRRMVGQMETQARVAGIESAERSISKTPYEAMIIASLIEREARTPDDRGRISQVILNRLFQGMRLQIDATVIYALGEDRQRVSNDDLRVNSQYNTYRIPALPPTPIASPGRASMEATVEPTPGTWLYYVVIDGAGNHAFANTLAEHNANIRRAEAAGVR